MRVDKTNRHGKNMKLLSWTSNPIIGRRGEVGASVILVRIHSFNEEKMSVSNPNDGLTTTVPDNVAIHDSALQHVYYCVEWLAIGQYSCV